MLNNLNIPYFTEIILGLLVISLIISLFSLIRLGSLNKKYKTFMQALSGKDVEKLLLEHIGRVDKMASQHNDILDRLNELANSQKTCFQKYGVIRYTAFDDVGSDLSFAVALLDGKDDGVILNGVYSREGSSVYAKPVHGGQSKHQLSDEEQKALENAKRRGQAV